MLNFKSKILNLKSGFTLIELLVVISIIGILAGLTLTGFAAARKNARDTQRKSDLQQYKAALEAYAANNQGRYPNESGDNCATTASGIFDGAGSIIIEYLPTNIDDPVDVSPQCYTYVYYLSGSAPCYRLYTTLETGGNWVLCCSGFAGKRTDTNCPY